MKSEGAGLLFKLRGDRTPDEWRAMSAEPARALGSLAFDLGQMHRQAAGAWALEAARALESCRRIGEQMRAAVAEITRPDGLFAQAARMAEDVPSCEVDESTTGRVM